MRDVRTSILQCRYEQGVLHKLYYRQSQNILGRLVSPDANYYLKPNDIISYRPTLFGYHEPHLEALFKSVAATHNDFLLDIGANIGLSAIISGSSFTDIHCFEPNCILAKILDVNLELNGLSHKTKIHNVGLGDKDKLEDLWIPRDNFGGAYVKRGNAYDGTNDTMRRSDENNHIVQKIQLVDAKAALSELFEYNQNWRKGLVKIDVEGLELQVFEAVLATLPKKVSAVIVMENFLTSVDFDSFQAPQHNLEWFGFQKQKNWLKSIPFKILGMSSYYVQKVHRMGSGDTPSHDLIVVANPKS